MKFIKLFIAVLLLSAAFFACNNDPVTTQNDDRFVISNNTGLVDSVWINGCYPNLETYSITDLNLTDYSKIKFEMDGLSNSDGSFIQLLYRYDNGDLQSFYFKKDMNMVNGDHTVTIDKPNNKINIELRLYINPPICVENEFKYTRVRDLKIYGIK